MDAVMWNRAASGYAINLDRRWLVEKGF